MSENAFERPELENFKFSPGEQDALTLVLQNPERKKLIEKNVCLHNALIIKIMTE